MATFAGALQLQEQGRLEECERVCHELLRQSDDPQILLLLGDLCRGAGRPEEAADWYKKAAIRLPRCAEPLYGLALLHLSGPHIDVAAALDAVDSVIEMRPNHGNAHAILSRLLKMRGQATGRYPVSVVTPTVGTDFVARAIASVQAQTYGKVEHLIFVDGPTGLDKVSALVPSAPRHPIHVFPLPYNTGKGGFNGHLIYAASAFLARGRYISFLDEDNWFLENHLKSLMDLIESRGLDWAYSLRNIHETDGSFVCRDDCESLGQWDAWEGGRVIDQNCYCLRRDIAVQLSWIYNRRYLDSESPDILLCKELLSRFPNFETTSGYTSNYTVSRSPHSLNADYFKIGNAKQLALHPDGLPWRKPAPGAQAP